MIQNAKKSTVSLVALLSVTAFSPVSYAATLSDVFTGDMLGANQRYFESIAGIPRESWMNDHSFKVENCEVVATIVEEKVVALRLEVNADCKADLSSFIQSYAPENNALPFGLFAKPLTFGQFTTAAGPVSYSADCLSMCGNAYDPSVYAHWHGPRAAQFLEVLLEVKLVGDDALQAAQTWQDHMEKAAGEDYVIDTKFNCDNRFSEVAERAFDTVAVTAVTVGYSLSAPSCD